MLNPLNPKESNGPLIDNEIFNRLNGLNGLNFHCAQLCIWHCVGVVNDYAQQKQKFQETIFVCSYGAQVEVVETLRGTVPLMVFLQRMDFCNSDVPQNRKNFFSGNDSL